MISTDRTRVKIKDIVSSQIPSFVRDSYPLLSEFFKEYYSSQEYSGSTLDLLQNIDQYFNLDSLLNHNKTCVLSGDLDPYATTVNVVYDPSQNILGTYGFPDRYGLLKVDNEIILYKSKTDRSFTECVRGFSGISKYGKGNEPDQLVFEATKADSHLDLSTIENLSVLFLEKFLTKLKNQFLPGFEDRDISSKVNQKTLISRIADFYDAKGTEDSIKILFGLLYGEEVKIVNPKDFLLVPSGSTFTKTKDLIVEALEGNPTLLKNRTLRQDAIPEYGFNRAEAAVTNVEVIKTDGKDFYRIKLDYDYDDPKNASGGTYGPFQPHPSTKLTNAVSVGATVLDVDSTVGFPVSGKVVVSLPFDQTETLSYTSKSLNQFFGVDPVSSAVASGSNVRLDVVAYGYTGISTSETLVRVKIGPVFNNVKILDNTFYFAKDDKARITYPGIIGKTAKENDWFTNVKIRYNVSNISLIDSTALRYRVTTYDSNIFSVRDIVTLKDSSSNTFVCDIISVDNKTTFTIRSQTSLVISSEYSIERNIKKSLVNTSLSKYSYINNYNADVQSVYSKFSGNVLVASPSIPFYKNQPLSFYDKVIPLNGSYSSDTLTISSFPISVNDHGYYTGDSVFYRTSSIPTTTGAGTTVFVESKFTDFNQGPYFVKRVNGNQIKLARSRADLKAGNFLNISGEVTSNFIEPLEYRNLQVKPQNLLRIFKEPNNESGYYETPPGQSTGMFINGVELTNYKTTDFVRFGEIEGAFISKPGDGYDVINPPLLSIADETGIGATGSVSVKGNLLRIEVLETGFDYVLDPSIEISGGNGLGAKAKANTSLIVHSVPFYSTLESGQVNLSNNTIGFSSDHKFRTVERVVYKTDSENGLAGLSTNAFYYVKVIDAQTIKLFNSSEDATAGINTVSLGGYGTGIHRIEATSAKKVVTSVLVTDSGENYENKERTCEPTGINTSLNYITIQDHGYSSGEILTYSSSGNPVGGLSTSSKYVVTKVDNNNFRLSQVGIASTNKYFYYETKQYVDLVSTGTEVHTFNYEPITVTISGQIGVSTFTGQDLNAKLQPVFRGSLESVNIKSGGIGYGSSDILNYDRQPIFELLSGKDAELFPVVNNGSIVEVIVNYGGVQYNSPPDLLITGIGTNAILTPVLSNGRINSVRVINGGSGYDSKTSISVVPSGRGSNISFKIKQWNVNLVEKSINILGPDDGLIKKSIGELYGLQYAHAYTPRKLRESVYQKIQNNEVKYGVYDLSVVNGQETTSRFHSPIIGWAYDGNPIYGPYGFSSKTGGTTRLMKSGYELVSNPNRPQFPQGFFVEDYEFKGTGDLDEHNGRYCVTPEYPNGTYAYFTTIDVDSIEVASPFTGYRKPVFPYVIGNTFKSKPVDFNFDIESNQDSSYLTTDAEDGPWLRNTAAYNLQSQNTFYDYFTSPLKNNNYLASIKSTSKGQIERVNILNSGNDYKVNDRIYFNTNTSNDGKGASAIVSEVNGKEIVAVSAASTSITNAEVSPINSDGGFIVFTENPHGLLNDDVITITGINTSTLGLQGSYKIGVSSSRYSLVSAIGSTSTTGIVTYISLSGNVLNSTIRENDILRIDSERFKVLNVDFASSRVRVLREVSGTIGTSHTTASVVYEIPRKFTFASKPQDKVIFERDKEIYFNPKESVALGSTSGVGIGSTIVFSNPGVGVTQIFIPTRSIYLEQHGLITGDPIIYSNNGGSSIIVSNGSTTFNLQNSSTVYAANISDNLLGISTVQIGIGASGTFVGIGSTNSNQGLLYFVGFGSGVYHSFKTNKANAVKSEITKNTVTVAISTTFTHGLSLNDEVKVSALPSVETTVVIKYNDYNRRMVANPRDFAALDVDTDLNTITILNHKMNTGDPIIHTSPSPSGGLENQKIYYIINHTKDQIKLSTSKYGSELFEKEVVNITSASSGTISPINPQIETYTRRLVFDLSDSSLSSLSGVTSYSAFDFKLYTDKEFTQEYNGNLSGNSFNVEYNGQIGLSSGASMTLNIDDRVPTKLFYRLSPLKTNFVSPVKSEIILDTDVTNNNILKISPSKYSGLFTVSGVGNSTFNYYLTETAESSSYTSLQGSFTYKTTSTSAVGGISSVKITSSGYGYSKLPGISSISSQNGYGAILEPSSSGIGSVLSISPDLLGYDYPTDKTLRPSCNLPEIFEVTPFYKIDSIGVTSAGTGYALPPQLILIDEYRNLVVNEVDLRFNIGQTNVEILKNTNGITGRPKIVPVNNSNGFKIGSITYNSTTKDVSVGLNTGFSDVFPLSVGDKVLIENVSVGVGSTGKGYNSENYNYRLFTIKAVPAGITGLGGNVGIITFSMSDFLGNGEVPGNFDSINSRGRLIPEKYFPVFDIKLKKNAFANEEILVSGDKVGQVESWNDSVNLLSVSSSKEFITGDIVKGLGTKTLGVVGKKYDFDAYVDTAATSEITIGWQNEVGFLNNNLHRIQDNLYYQNFSYTLKSKVPFDDWNNTVSSITHPTGFLKFSDLQLESTPTTKIPIITSNQGSNVDIFNDFVSQVDLSCYPDYDSVTENKLNNSSRDLSSEIYFSNRVLTDYFESIGNRVLTIDDFSSQFNSDPRPTPYSVIDEFDVDHKVKKYFTYIRDKRYTGERQSMFVTVAHNGVTGYLNQYGRVETVYDLGSFDVAFSSGNGYLLYYPTLYEVNDFDVSYISFDLNSAVAGVGSTSLGDTVKIKTEKVSVAPSTTSTIVSIGTSYRASKVLVQLDKVADSSVREVDELNIIHDGTNVEVLEYGQMTTTGVDAFEASGLGTYSAYISGGNVKIDFTANAGVGTVNVNSLQVSIANTSSSGVGTHIFGFENQSIGFIDSRITAIASTSAPIANVIAEYNNINYDPADAEDQHDASYFVVCVEDTTNNRYQMSEVIVVDDENEAYITEYGNVETNGSLGDISAGSGITHTQLLFTPNPNIDVQVRVFQTSLQLVNPTSFNSQLVIDMNNGEINAGFGNYSGTFSDVKRSFDLKHGGRDIFKREFLGNQSSVVDPSSDTILLPGHFFVTGEELVYSHAGAGSSQAIGIANTYYSVGIGNTDKLPSQVYAVKVDELRIKLSNSAENALKAIPLTLDITSVGVGTSHSFTGKNQNGKCLVAIDNFIQSPIVSTSVTTGIVTSISLIDNIIKVTGFTSFFGGDLIRVNNEIMKIESVGFGSTNQVLVRRPWMGTKLALHPTGSLVTKIDGNYNIVENTINFVDAPKGLTPIGSTTNSPDERDWTGISTSAKFQGRVFMRTAEINSSEEVYSKNYVFDDISDQFNAVKKTFTLKSNGQNIAGFSTNNAIVLVNGIFQSPQGTLVPVQDYQLTEGGGISSIRFLGAATSITSDPNTATIPVGGVIVSVGSTNGLGYQPLVAAGGTANISAGGTVSSISIGNSGSGYRSGIQTVVNVGVYTASTATPNIHFVGTASISNGHVVSVAITNPGTGYTSSNPPKVVFDSPLSYSNIPLVYSSSATAGLGTEATIDIVVGQGSSVIDFELSNLGYGYASDQILTVNTGGATGIPTDISKPFNEFQIRIERVASNKFAGWNVGELDVFDKIEDQFDGIRRKFIIKKGGSPVTIRSKQGSNIDVQSTLIVFLNNILQVPGEGYTFTGGSVITFAEPPKPNANGISGTGDKVQIFFYKGTGSVDVQFTDIIETVKVGDTLTINDSASLCATSVQQDERLITEIISSDTVETNPYVGSGINDDPRCIRPVTWCQQRSDRLVNGIVVGKSRDLFEPVVNPVSYIIKSVGSASTVVYVDTVKPIYNAVNENTTSSIQNKIDIISQDSVVGASATAVVSVAGTISSIVITDGGFGYTSNPQVTIQTPVGIGTTQRAVATASVTSGVVTSIVVSYGGTTTGLAYTTSNPPVVLIEPPKLIKETNTIASYSGDDGVIVGFGTTTISGTDKVIFDLFIPIGSYLRNNTYVSVATTISGLSSGDYFLVNNSNVGLATTGTRSKDNSSNLVAIGTSFVDNVYYVDSAQVIQRTVASPGLGGTTGIGITYVLRVSCPIDFTNTIHSGAISTTTSSVMSFGNFSWGKINLNNRTKTNSFTFYGNNGIAGITTSAIVSRTNRLRYKNYT